MKKYWIGFKVVIIFLCLVLTSLQLEKEKINHSLESWIDYVILFIVIAVATINIGTSIRDLKQFLNDSN